MSEWNAVLYDNKHDFVAEYGKGLLEFVPKNKHQSILDLGCGTGTLTAQLSNLADTIIGVDSSASMIAKAKGQYANIQFVVCDALTLPFEKQFDVVFSNAVFHWIADHNVLLKQVNDLSGEYEYDENFISESRRYFESGEQTTVIAFDGETPVGCASLSYIWIMPTYSHPTGNRAHLMNVYTRADHRRIGISKKMVEILIDEEKANGVSIKR